MKSKKSEKANLEKHRSAFFQLGLVIALSVSLLAFEWVSPVLEKHEIKGKLAKEEAPYIISEIIPKKEEIQQKKQNQPQKQSQKSSDNIKVDSVDRKDNLKDIVLPDDSNLTFIVEKGDEGPVIETGVKVGPLSIVDVDVMPEFPGGRKALKEFLAKNTKYPEKARSMSVQGVAKISFVVDENGDVIDAKIIDDVSNGCGKEALRVVNSMPKWSPAKIEGKAVPVYYEVKVNFQLK